MEGRLADEQHQTRDRIFQVAAQLIATKGFSRVSMREISEAAGVSKPMLYYYFDSKEGLLRALLEENLNQMEADTRRILQRDIPVSEKLRQAIIAEFRGSQERPELVRLYLEILGNPDRYPEISEYLRERMAQDSIIQDFISEGQNAGVFRPDVNPAIAAGVFHGTLGFFLGNSMHFSTPPLNEELADTVFRVFIEGMQAQPGSSDNGSRVLNDA